MALIVIDTGNYSIKSVVNLRLEVTIWILKVVNNFRE